MRVLLPSKNDAIFTAIRSILRREIDPVEKPYWDKCAFRRYGVEGIVLLSHRARLRTTRVGETKLKIRTRRSALRTPPFAKEQKRAKSVFCLSGQDAHDFGE